jgi:hypothetical protein
MSIKGFPSSQKAPLGTGITSNFATVIPTDPYRNALETPRFAFRVDSAIVPRTAAANTGVAYINGDDAVLWIYDTATPAMVGDFVRFEDGAAAYLELPIVKVETNRFMVSCVPSTLPVAGDDFYIMRYATQRTDSTGSQIATISLPVKQVVEKIYSEYATVPVGPSTWVQLIASTSADITSASWQESSGYPMELALGGAGSEVAFFNIFPGGFNGALPMIIPAGSRLSIRGLTGEVANSVNTFIVANLFA